MAGTKLVTAEQLLRMGPDARRELVRGELVEMSPGGARHSGVGAYLGYLLLTHLEAEGGSRGPRGRVYSADCGFLLERDPDTVRAPDVSYVRGERLAGLDETRFLPLVPDLAAEVVSPSDTFRAVEERAAMWLDSGVRLVWVVEPEQERIYVHRPGAPRGEVAGEDLLEGGDVLPGFAVPAAAVFRRGGPAAPPDRR